ncbi:MAG: 1-acyl-sn-glycerol-3-phosphate acyltransferase [Myxococcaceae bacterium]|nr:1-acyl-sn-glycerol-3-phosphate acyltransferase [Myxococcaceae bacterium]
MRLNPIAVLSEKPSPIGKEAGIDPLPVGLTSLDPLYKAWSVLGAWPLAIGMMSLAAGTSLPLSLLLPFEKTMKQLPQPIMGAVPAIALGKRSITYHPDFDPKRVSMFLMNHTSVLDAHVACWAIPHAFCGVQHQHHFDVPVYGWLMKRGNGIGVLKGKDGQAQWVADQVRDRARRGISVLGFPEGRRTQNGRILPFRKGLLIMARDGGLPVVPLAVRGLWQILRKGEWVVRRHPLDVYVGPQIETKGLDDDQIERLADKLHRFTSDYVERGVLGDVAALQQA